MEVRFTPEIEAKLNEMAAATGRGPDDLVQDAISGYFEELSQTRSILDSRYDDVKSGRVKPVDGEEFFETLRQRETQLIKSNSQQ